MRSACAECGVRLQLGEGLASGAIGAFANRASRRVAVAQGGPPLGGDAIMPRSVLPSLAVLVGGGPRLRPVLLDADGLEIDERVEFAGLKANGLVYRILRGIEARMVRKAKAILVRTAAAREILMERAGPPADPAKYTVVANGRDGRVFHPFDEESRRAVRSELGIAADAPLIVYVGSFGPKYRTRAVGELALALHGLRPDTRLLVLSLAPEQVQSELLDPFPDLAPFTTVLRAPFRDVARYLAAADVGTVFITETFSTRTVVPVKTGEYLLCGVPAVGTPTIGDNEAALGAGVFFDDRRGAASGRWVIERKSCPTAEEYRRRAPAPRARHYSLEKSLSDYARRWRSWSTGRNPRRFAGARRHRLRRSRANAPSGPDLPPCRRPVDLEEQQIVVGCGWSEASRSIGRFPVGYPRVVEAAGDQHRRIGCGLTWS